MIQAQGEILDNIEANIEDTNDYMEKAQVNLKNAQELHEESKTKTKCLLICIFVFILMLFILIF